ncbi:hypothetical protein V8C86DRAFT_2802116 [Haematococcus lacustris]
MGLVDEGRSWWWVLMAKVAQLQGVLASCGLLVTDGKEASVNHPTPNPPAPAHLLQLGQALGRPHGSQSDASPHSACRTFYPSCFPCCLR